MRTAPRRPPEGEACKGAQREWLLKSSEISQRISQARQNSSSITGTMTTARMVRNASTPGCDCAAAESEVRAAPAIAFWNSQCWR